MESGDSDSTKQGANKRAAAKSSGPTWIQPVLEAAKGLPAPLRYAIIFLVPIAAIILAQQSIPGNLVPLIYFLGIAGFAGGLWLEWLQHRAATGVSLRPSTKEKQDQSPSTEKLPHSNSTAPISSPEPLRERYLKLMVTEWRTLRWAGIHPEAGDAEAGPPMTLEQVYVGLDTRSTKPRKESDNKAAESLDWRGNQSPLSAVEALCQAPEGHMVLLGQPGSGKSTFARHLALRLAQASLNPVDFDFETYLPDWTGSALLPVFVSLGRLARFLSSEAGDGTSAMIETFIKEDTETERRKDLSGYGTYLIEEMNDHGAVVFFDGLDEVPAAQRKRVKHALTNFAALHDKCRILVTCRTHSYRTDRNWQLDWSAVHELAPFNQDKITAFIDAWYRTLEQFDSARSADYARKAVTLKKALDPTDPRHLAELAETPLLLTVMAIVHTHKDELPDSRVEVYKECVDILLLRWHTERTPDAGAKSLINELRSYDVKRASLYRGLWELAYEAQRTGEGKSLGGDGRAVVSEGIIRKAMHRYLGGEGLRVFLDYCQSANGLLLAQGVVNAADAPPDSPPIPVYSFPHLTFQEYLAARHLRRLKNFTRQAAKLAGDPVWREVILFLGETLCFDEDAGDTDLAQVLLDKLCPEKKPLEDTDWRRVWLAGELLPGVRSEAPADELHEDLDDRIVRRLVELLGTSQALAEAPEGRAAAGRALSRLGDPRPGVGLTSEGLPDIDWVEIPSGQVTLEDKKGSTYQVEPFRIARYPVTNLQFQAFIDAEDGYRNDMWWADLDQKGSPGPPYWNEANHPRENVTWNEAVAFCRWLSNRLGYEVRLPTEQEWQQAATGGDPNNVYPWGPDWDSARCNSAESVLNRTTAVGMYPNGSTPQGVFDMAGNVWEWCSNKYKNPKDTSIGGTDWRVWRGGSWGNAQGRARAAARSYGVPDLRYFDLGFRVCCLSPIT
jgi:formylglycine-generating enzyme required for sulfatase activity